MDSLGGKKGPGKREIINIVQQLVSLRHDLKDRMALWYFKRDSQS